MRAAYFRIERELSRPDFLVIRDIGPHDQYQTVTNAAESVVESLAEDGLLPDGRRLFYFDSDGYLDEIVVSDGEFVTFSPMRHEHSELPGQRYIDNHCNRLVLIPHEQPTAAST